MYSNMDHPRTKYIHKVKNIKIIISNCFKKYK
jgi:hypothetical protein